MPRDPLLARIHAAVLGRRASLDRAALAAAVLLPLAFAAVALVADDWRARRFLLAYVAPFFVALPLWVRCRLAGAWPGRVMAVDAVVVALAGLRFLGGFLPFSGHALFFTYSLVTERTGWYRALALLLLAETAYFKLVVWSDPRSFAAGILLGLAFAALHRRIR